MPLYNIEQVRNNGKIGIWHITESLDELLKMKQLSEVDLFVLNSFSYEHRKKEWLTARILAEQLSNEKDIRIIYDEHNKPFLKNSKKHISISHSHNLLAIILDEHETGIDIELIKTKVLRIKEKFMSAAELKSLQKENMVEQLTVYWCAKESLYKLYGKKELAFKENLAVEPFRYSADKGIIRGWINKSSTKRSFTLQYEKLNPIAIGSGDDSYMLAYVINED
ncbi:MAG: 4'-phosphopantetheinyl transferase superfamily protein [Bacteroidetes bacterium]|nr:4'-phosphopantetheinyl transferase superfamily protein [Bacteroidota bacterium]